MTITEFLRKYKKVQNNVRVDLPTIDFAKLSEAMEKSKFLQSRYSLAWLIRKYDEIIAGKYFDFPPFERERKSSIHFGTERTYTDEELKNMFVNFEDVEF